VKEHGSSHEARQGWYGRHAAGSAAGGSRWKKQKKNYEHESVPRVRTTRKQLQERNVAQEHDHNEGSVQQD
jgi:hypothetical protein